MDKTKDQKILIDSCILVYSGTDKFSDETKKLLRLLADNKNKLAISELCGFEVLKNCQNKDNFKYYIKLIDYLDNIPINKDILINAASLHSLYGKPSSNKEDGNFQKEKSTGDLIIGGTAAYYETLLLTANLNDFPLPYWEIVAHDFMMYEDNRRFKLINRYLLRFNYDEAKKNKNAMLLAKK